MLLHPKGTGRPRGYCSHECWLAGKQQREPHLDRIDGFELATETIAAGGDWRVAVAQWEFHEGYDVQRIASIVGRSVEEVEATVGHG